MHGRKYLRKSYLTKFVLGLLLVLTSTAASAHHGWNGYDSKTTLTLTGMIKESGYEHPHGFVKLQTPEKLWFVVLAPPYRMENRGLARDELKPGAQATVVGYPHRTEQNEMRAERITVGPKTVELR
jgi:hypothetical protein